MAGYALVGPPEAQNAATALAAAAEAPRAADAFLDQLDTGISKETGDGAPGKALTENSSPTFVSSGDPCLDFFFQVVPSTPAASVASLLAAAWAADPATALRLVANLRGVRGSGKSDREGFYAAALWLHAHHPATLARNAASVAAFGYLKDLPELLHRIVHGGRSTRTPGKKARLRAEGRRRFFRPSAPKPRREDRAPRVGTSEERAAASLEHDRQLAAAAAARRRSRRADAAARALELYSSDATYRSLHDRTADLFAQLLAEDMRKLADGKVR